MQQDFLGDSKNTDMMYKENSERWISQVMNNTVKLSRKRHKSHEGHAPPSPRILVDKTRIGVDYIWRNTSS